MIIETKELPAELLNKLPLTLRLSKQIDTNHIKDTNLKNEIENYIKIKQLEKNEYELQLLLDKQKSNENRILVNNHRYSNRNQENIMNIHNYQKLLKQTIEIRPVKSLYSIYLITDPGEFIIEQIRTFLSTGTIHIPFSPEINFDIEKYVFHIDSPTIKEELYNIIDTFLDVLITETKVTKRNEVKLIDIVLKKQNMKLYIEYIVNIILQIQNKERILSLTYQDKAGK